MVSCERSWPVFEDSEYLTKWKQSLQLNSDQSPFAPVREPTETLVHRILTALENADPSHSSHLSIVEGVNNERTLTSGELRHRVLATASFLRSSGFGRGDRAVIAIPNMIEFPIFHLGVWAAGGILIGSSVVFKTHETQYQLIDSSPKIILTTEEYLPTIVEVRKHCPTIENDLPDGIVDFKNVIAHSIDGITPEPNLDDVALIYYTSGTTGLRKGVIHTHRFYHSILETIRSHWLSEIYPATGRMSEKEIMKEHQLITPPCYHVLGFNLINIALISGSPVVFINGFQDGNLLKCIEKYKPSVLSCTPAMVAYLSKQEGAGLSSVKIVVSGGHYLRENVANRFILRYPHIDYVVQRYGLSELPHCHAPMLFHKGFNSSVGVVVSRYQRKLVNIESREVCKRGEIGELLMKAPDQTIGYLNRPESTEKLFDADGWIRTGDIGYIDDLGQFHFVDRLKDMLKVQDANGSYSVSPAEIEDAILCCSKVADVAIVGIPDDEASKQKETLLRAYVVKGDYSLTAEEVEEVVKEKLAHYKFITGGVRFIDTIPRSANGKMLRQQLRNYSQIY